MSNVTLRALIEVSKDGEWGQGEPCDDCVAMAVIRGTDFAAVRHGDLSKLPVRFVPRQIAERKRLQPDDIIIETAGGSKDRPTGRTLYIKPSVVRRSPHPLICASFSRFIRVVPSAVEPRFVFWYLQYLYECGYLLRYHTQHTGVARFQFTTFADSERLRLPPLPIQRKIAGILSAYDDLIENNTRRIAILEEMARELYREWFVRFRFPGHEGVRMVESALGAIPEGWRAARLSELVETQYGYTESATAEQIGPRFLRGMDINKGSFIRWDEVPYCPIGKEDHTRYRLSVGDIVVIRMADPGKVGIVEKDIDAVFASYLIRLHITSADLLPHYLFYFLQSDRFQDYITGASTGTTRKSASAGVITDIGILIPPREVRTQFEHQVSGFRLMLNNLLDTTANLRRTRELLLPKLVSGEVEVGMHEIEYKL